MSNLDQQIAAGYKQTEIGEIPEDWDVIRIDELADIRTGAKNTQDRVVDGKFPFFVRSQQVEKINSYSFDGEAVLTAGDGVGTGKVFHYICGKFDVHQRVYQICKFSNNLDGKYFFYQFRTRFYDRIMSMTAKSSVDSVRREMIAGMLIPCPKLSEQSAIAAIISDTDALIENLEKLIAKKTAIKKGAMQQLLTGKRRLPGFSGEWKLKKLGDIAETEMGQSPLSEYYNKKGIGLPLIQGNADVENRQTVIRSYTSSITKKGRIGDIIMSVRAPVGEVSKATFDCCLGRGVCAIRFPNDYLYHYLVFFEKEWVKFSTGSTFDSVNSAQVKEQNILVPEDKSEQIAIAEVISDIDKEIDGIKKMLQKYRQIKTGMMQKLLTGKIRIHEPAK